MDAVKNSLSTPALSLYCRVNKNRADLDLERLHEPRFQRLGGTFGTTEDTANTVDSGDLARLTVLRSVGYDD
jgi:hypothetical protein